MNRRRFIAGIAVGGSGLLTGCSGDDGSSEDDPDGTDTGSDEPTETATPTPDEEAAAERIESARTEIQSAIDLLVEATGNDDQNLDHDTFSQHLESAENSLESAKSDATDEQRERITDLVSIVAYLGMRGDAETAVSRTFEDHLVPGREAYWNGREPYFQEDVGVPDLEQASERFDGAIESFTSATETFAEARQLVSNARDKLTEIEPQRLNSFEDITHGDAVSDAEGFVPVVRNFESFSTGLETGSRAWVQLSTAFIATEDGAWSEAVETFESAEATFGDAVETLQAVPLDDLGFLANSFSNILCEIGNGPDAARHWVSAAQAGMDGNQQTYEDEALAGWELLAACHGDG